jgi:hypothetical protein
VERERGLRRRAPDGTLAPAEPAIPHPIETMNHSIHLQPDELSRLVVQAAANAESEGFWTGPGRAAEDAGRHLVRVLGLLLGGDDHVDTREMNLFAQVHAAATGEHLAHDELLASVNESVAIADDPERVEAFLSTTPPFLRAIIEMDRSRGTRNAEQVVTAMSGLALALLAADGKAEPEEDAVFTTHLEHLRREVAALGAAGQS